MNVNICEATICTAMEFGLISFIIYDPAICLSPLEFCAFSVVFITPLRLEKNSLFSHEGRPTKPV